MLSSKQQDTIKANFKRAKLLIIEDNPDHWTLTRRALQECLPEVVAVHIDTPKQALKLLNDWVTQEWELPKLILQDLYMPDRADGWRAAIAGEAAVTTAAESGAGVLQNWFCQLQAEFSLRFHEVRALALGVGALDFEDLV